jgi:hypothetical protein
VDAETGRAIAADVAAIAVRRTAVVRMSGSQVEVRITASCARDAEPTLNG